MDTCAPVSINTGITLSFNLQYNMHFCPANLAPFGLSFIEQAVWYEPLLNTSFLCCCFSCMMDWRNTCLQILFDLHIVLQKYTWLYAL